MKHTCTFIVMRLWLALQFYAFEIILVFVSPRNFLFFFFFFFPMTKIVALHRLKLLCIMWEAHVITWKSLALLLNFNEFKCGFKFLFCKYEYVELLRIHKQCYWGHLNFKNSCELLILKSGRLHHTIYQ